LGCASRRKVERRDLEDEACYLLEISSSFSLSLSLSLFLFFENGIARKVEGKMGRKREKENSDWYRNDISRDWLRSGG